MSEEHSVATTDRASLSAWRSSCCNYNRRRRSFWNICEQKTSSTLACLKLSPSDNLTPIPHRYLRALAAFYIRLTFDAIDVYETLEPMLDDYRKLRFRNLGKYLST